MIAWPVVVVERPDDRGFSHRGMRHQRRLDLGRRDAVAADVHDVVDAAEQPEIALVVELAPVAGEVAALEPAPIRVEVPLRIPPDAAQHARPRLGQREVAAASFDDAARIVDDLGADSGQRERRRPRLRGGRAGQRADHDPAGLGLPPGVDHRACSAADVLAVPHPRFGVDRFADRSEQPQRRQVVLGRLLRPPTS